MLLGFRSSVLPLLVFQRHRSDSETIFFVKLLDLASDLVPFVSI